MKLQALPCYCATLRQAARAISAVYEDAFAGTGLYATQFTVLQLLQTAGALSTTDVAETLGVDQTTASRILAILNKDGLIEILASPDRRRRVWTLTAEGNKTVGHLQPVWDRAQKAIEKTLGRAAAQELKAASYATAVRLSEKR